MASQVSVCVTPMLQSSGAKYSAKSKYPINLSLQSSFHSLRGTRSVRIIKAKHENSFGGFQPTHPSQASQDSVLFDEWLGAVKNDDKYAESFHQ
ncbi:hypothetical protein RYX36_034142, partial [Vicia faba]